MRSQARTADQTTELLLKRTDPTSTCQLAEESTVKSQVTLALFLQPPESSNCQDAPELKENKLVLAALQVSPKDHISTCQLAKASMVRSQVTPALFHQPLESFRPILCHCALTLRESSQAQIAE